MKTKSLSITFGDSEVSVDSGSSIALPSAFEASVREDLVRRAVHSSRANRRQAYGHRDHQGRRKPVTGMKH
ncbi:MAG: hypothetical protein QGH13_03205 [Candidatus Thalassarchaeaceae archaeon]|nr:hypothetical protein [Candidatus Thalassarchaeaceae archaeon]